jgi:hypothetical protein
VHRLSNDSAVFIIAASLIEAACESACWIAAWIYGKGNITGFLANTRRDEAPNRERNRSVFHGGSRLLSGPRKCLLVLFLPRMRETDVTDWIFYVIATSPPEERGNLFSNGDEIKAAE